MILLDTHLWFWFINQEVERYPRTWQDALETTECLAVSVVSCIEVALAQKKGRLILPCPVREWIDEALEPSGITLLPLKTAACVKATELSDIHRDPFDRLIVATAIEEDATLATLDSLVRSYPEMRHHLLSP